jgi:hypothetical protein
VWTERAGAAGSRPPSPELVARAREAEGLLRHCLATRAGRTNTPPGTLGDTRSRLGGAIMSVAFTDPDLMADARAAMLAEAETLLVEGQELMESSPSRGDSYPRDGLVRLVRFYTASHQPGPAGEWQRKLAAFDQAAAEKKSRTAPGASL